MRQKIDIEKTVFVVRSVPVEDMSPVLDTCSRRWPEKDLVVICDFKSQAELSADSRVSDVIVPAELTEGFRGIWRTENKARILVIPVKNRNGVGYARVLRFLSRVGVSEWYVASQLVDLQRVSSNSIRWRIQAEQTLRCLCTPFSFLWGLIFLSKEPRANIV